MSTEVDFKDGALYVRRTYEAPRTKVFEAWVETSLVQQWWGCAQTIKVESNVEAKVGGQFRHEMTIEGAGVHAIDGTLIAYEPPSFLVFTFTDAQTQNLMKVEVDFFERGGRTEVLLKHQNVQDAFRDIVAAGWTAAFGKLELLMAAENVG